MVAVPVSVPPCGVARKATVTAFVAPTIVFPPASCIATRTAGAMTTVPSTLVGGCVMNASRPPVGGPVPPALHAVTSPAPTARQTRALDTGPARAAPAGVGGVGATTSLTWGERIDSKRKPRASAYQSLSLTSHYGMTG